MSRKCLEFELGEVGAETAQLLEVGRCRRIHIQWLSDADKTDFWITSGI